MLVTRPRDRSPDFVAELRRRGAFAVIAPLVSIDPPDDPEPFRDALARLRDFDWCVFTSLNAVDAFATTFDAPRHVARALRGIHIAAVGTQTAQHLERYGVRDVVVPKEHIGEALAASIAERAAAGARILIVRAQEGRDALPDALRDRGFAPSVVAAYQTSLSEPPHFVDDARSADAIAFASASAVRGFVAAAGGAKLAPALVSGKVVACIGPVAADAARAAGFAVEVVATPYTGRALIDALSAHFAAKS
ncbi:MAG TPA: uroporphyrinogen-III synthase [Candidatus Tumulicola sp.]